MRRNWPFKSVVIRILPETAHSHSVCWQSSRGACGKGNAARRGATDAAAAQVQRRNQVFDRGRRVALAPEKLQSLDEYFFTVERFRASDSASLTSESVHIVLIVPESVKSLGSGSPLRWNRKCMDRVGLYREEVLALPASI